jgi:cellobiose-specific phosphotransferase system component IIA
MLGIDSKETPIVTGAYADEIREAVRRAYQGQFNEADKKVAARSDSIKQEYDAVWK